jgi:hypothetical protein
MIHTPLDMGYDMREIIHFRLEPTFLARHPTRSWGVVDVKNWVLPQILGQVRWMIFDRTVGLVNGGLMGSPEKRKTYEQHMTYLGLFKVIWLIFPEIHYLGNL